MSSCVSLFTICPCLSIYLSNYLFIYIYLCLSTYLSIYLSIYISIYLSIYQYIYIYSNLYIQPMQHIQPMSCKFIYVWKSCMRNIKCYFFYLEDISVLIYLYVYICMSVCVFVYVHIYIYISIYMYGIYHWRIHWSNYRKLSWVGSEPTTTEFCSDALTDWAIRLKLEKIGKLENTTIKFILTFEA